jgi:hypothetical protein
VRRPADVAGDRALRAVAPGRDLPRRGQLDDDEGSRGRRAADTHALVVVELPRASRGNDIEQALRALDVAEVLRTVFVGDETVAQLSRRRFAALTAREQADDLALDLLGLLLHRALGDEAQPRLWVERLPATIDGVAPVLAGLCE